MSQSGFETDISGAPYRKKCLKQKIQCCYVCGHSDYTFDLVVHHINGDRDDNKLSNLIPVCNSCHIKIHNTTSYDGPISDLENKLPSGVVDVPDSVRERAKTVKAEYDYPSLGEAIRHMCQEGGYDV